MAKNINKQKAVNSATSATPKVAPSDNKKATSFGVKQLSILLGIIACILYFNTTKNGFALDDFSVIRDNKIVTKGISAIGEIFATPYRRGWFVTTNDLYRPLSLAMFATEYQLSGGTPGLHHFMNVVVFALGVVVLFVFLNKLLGEKRMVVSFIAAFLFAVHPIHTEVVANIKSRDELLCFLFAFLSLYQFAKYVEDKGVAKNLLLGGLCYLLSLLSKETTITFLFVIPFVFFAFLNNDRKKSIHISIVSFAVAAIFLIIRISVLTKYHANDTSYVEFIDNALVKAPNFGVRLGTSLTIMLDYIQLLFAPFPLVCDYSYNAVPMVGLGNVKALGSLLIYVAMAVFAVYRLVKYKKDMYAFAIIFFLVTLSLFTNIPLLIGVAKAERLLFFCSVGFCLAIALLLEQYYIGNTQQGVSAITSSKTIVFLGAVGLLFGGMTISRNADWMDNITLFRADIGKSPNDSRLNYYIGTEMTTSLAEAEGNPTVRSQYYTEGIGYLRKAVEIYPEYGSGHSSIGNAYFHIGQYDSAEVHGLKALSLSDKDIISMNNLAGVYFMRQQYQKSIDLCNRALKGNPDYVNALSNKGLCFMKMGMYDSALKNLYHAIAVSPEFPSSYENMALTFRAMGREDSVAKYVAAMQQFRPGYKL